MSKEGEETSTGERERERERVREGREREREGEGKKYPAGSRPKASFSWFNSFRNLICFQKVNFVFCFKTLFENQLIIRSNSADSESVEQTHRNCVYWVEILPIAFCIVLTFLHQYNVLEEVHSYLTSESYMKISYLGMLLGTNMLNRYIIK